MSLSMYRIRIAHIIAMLCACFGFSAIPAWGVDVALQDDFEDSATTESAWAQGFFDGQDIRWSVTGGVFRADGTASFESALFAGIGKDTPCAIQTGLDTGYTLYSNTFLQTSFDMRFVSDPSSTTAGGVILAPSRPGSFTSLFFSINRAGGFFNLGINDGLSRFDEISLDEIPLPAGFDRFEWHHFDAVLSGGTITVTLDKTYTLSAEVPGPLPVDPAFGGPGGAVLFVGGGGFSANDAIVEFDNYTLTADADCDTPPESDPDHDGLTSSDEIEIYGTDPRERDTDGDGLWDGWEAANTTVDEEGNPIALGVDLVAMGANPLHKDVFVEIDYMVKPASLFFDDRHTHQPKLKALQMLIDAFATAPVSNPDGSLGIVLHMDAGPETIMNPLTGDKWGSLSVADPLPHTDELGRFEGEGNELEYFWNDTFDLEELKYFDDYSDIYFSKSGQIREGIFHYCIFAHRLGSKGFTGISNGSPSAELIVSLGLWEDDTGTVLQQAGTLMHELGHNFGFLHGADDREPYKPNYLSVMNYSFQMGGLIFEGSNGTLDYSRYIVLDLDEENGLDENDGLTFDPNDPRTDSQTELYGTVWYCAVSGGELASSVFAAGALNWDCDNEFDTNPVMVDINSHPAYPDTGKQNLRAYVLIDGNPQTDWDNLKFDGGAIGGLGASPGFPATTTVDELTREQDDLIPKILHFSLSGPGPTNLAQGASTIYEFKLANLGESADDYHLMLASPLGWAADSGLPLSVPLLPGETFTILVPVAVPPGTANGEFDPIKMDVQSSVNPTLHDSASATTTALNPPIAYAGIDQVVECVSSTGTVVNLDGTGSFSPRSIPLFYEWTGPFPEGGGSLGGSNAQVTLPLGVHSIALIVDDQVVTSLPDHVQITVQDTIPPTLTLVASPDALWPANHKMIDVVVSAIATDLCDPAPVITLVSVDNSESDNSTGGGDGNTNNDVQNADIGTADFEISLRAERRGKADGRVYTLTYRATDASGNWVEESVIVEVPHDQSAHSCDQPDCDLNGS